MKENFRLECVESRVVANPGMSRMLIQADRCKDGQKVQSGVVTTTTSATTAAAAAATANTTSK
jgi:hypothetical protein